MAGETLPTGSTNTQGLADWAAPYITDYLGKAKALSETPYQTYQGPLTAGASNLQNKVFSGLAGLTFPSNLGQSFASPMGQPQQRGFGPDVNNYGGPVSAGPGVAYTGNDFGGPMATLPASRAPRTEDDWNKFSSMARFGPGTDMEKAKADFLAGAQGVAPMQGQAGGPVSAGPGVAYTGNDFGDSMDTPIRSTGIPLPPGYNTGTLPTGTASTGIAGLTSGSILQPPQTSQQPSNIAQSYMNPYLQNVLTPQLDELRRQNDITNAATNAKMTQAGAFGGGRQAIMNAENYRNLMQEQNKTVGQGYASAYDKAMAQFNAEQGQAKDLANLMSTQGGIERGIESEGIAADKEEFEKQRQYPFQQVQFQRDMISGLPTGSVQNTPGQMSGVGQLLSALGGGAAAAKAFGYKDVTELLKGLGLSTGS
jgi:hypothetical protein